MANRDQKTIVALATAPGLAALAVVRLSGGSAFEIAARVFVPRGARPRRVARRATLGSFVGRDGGLIDEGIALLFPAPRSYTGEDLVEFTLHGNPVLARELIAACCAAGAVAAEPGEFTLRALRHGKVDLAQAEAIRDLTAAATLEQARVATRQLRGEVSRAVEPLAHAIFDLLADVEAGLDFADGEADLALSTAEVADRLDHLVRELERVLAASELARRVREGAQVVLLGPPNAGKSALFNALIGMDRVIVTDEPGTTRDLVEETVVIAGLPIVLIDAAGIGEPRGHAEREGMRRAHAAAARAALVLAVYDLGAPYRPAAVLEDAVPQLPVATHADLPWTVPPVPGSIVTSAKTGRGIEALRVAIADALDAPGARPIESVALATERHRQAAFAARELLVHARRLCGEGAGAELIAIDLRHAVAALREILGDVGPEELLGRIFARFCIGK